MAEKHNDDNAVPKQPPLVEDLRNHSQGTDCRIASTSRYGRPFAARSAPAWLCYEVEGLANIYYVFKYPNGAKVLLLGAWERANDPVAALVACSCPAA